MTPTGLTEIPAADRSGLFMWMVLLSAKVIIAFALIAPASSSLGSRQCPAVSDNLSAGQSEAVNLNVLIDGLQKRYSRMQSLATAFVQIYVGADGRVLRESGNLLLKRPRKARWDYETPEKKVFVSDGKSIFFYVQGERHATKSDLGESADPQIPFLFLLSRGNLRKDFSRIEIASQEKPVIAGNVVLSLTPKRAPEEFKQILAEVNPVSVEVNRLVVLEQKGARMDFRLDNVREGVAVPDSVFRFTPPPGVAIVKAGRS